MNAEDFNKLKTAVEQMVQIEMGQITPEEIGARVIHVSKDTETNEFTHTVDMGSILINNMKLRKNGLYRYTPNKGKTESHILQFTGTVRNVKDLLHWFFLTENGTTTFLSQSEVEQLEEINHEN